MEIRKAVQTLVPAFVLTLGGLVSAQDLTELLPEETFLALGMQDIGAAGDRFEPFVAEWQRLGLTDALAALAASPGSGMSGGAMSGGAAPSLEDLSAEEREVLDTFTSPDVLGQEAWIALSATSFSPLPALTLVTQVTPAGAERVQALLDEAGTDGVETLEESGATFYQVPIPDAEPLQVLAYTLTDDLLAVSTNPDELRGILRRQAGADEPSFRSAEGYQSTLQTLGEGTFYGFFNYARVADVVAPYAQNLGFDPLVERLSQAFRTVGAAGGVVSVNDQGLVTDGFLALNEAGGDTSLYNLLSADTAARADVPVPEGALSYSANAFNFGGWYDYLNELARTVPELGGDLDSLVLSFTGLNLRESVFSWAGDQFVAVTTGLGDVTEPGVPSENLLGDAVYLIGATNEAAAQRGLGALLQNLSQVAGSLSDPEGGAGQPQRSEETVAGTTVTRYDLAPGATVFYAVNGGYALIGTSAEAMARTLTAQAEGGQSSVLEGVPNGATGYAYTDNRATYGALAGQISSQIQTAAGMGGASNLDFAAVEDASAAFEEFLGFVAERLSSSLSYSEREEGGVRSHTETAVNWAE